MSNRNSKNLSRLVKTLYILLIIVIGTVQLYSTTPAEGTPNALPSPGSSPAASILTQLEVKGRAAKTGYSRTHFSNGWAAYQSCDVRNAILARDMHEVTFVGTTCKVDSGLLADPYTGHSIRFVRGVGTSDDVQIDHVVALGDAWQKGAQQLSASARYNFANDPLNLLAVDGPTNQDKGDSDAASWLPPNKSFRCDYVARQIAVKYTYKLWVTGAEYAAMARVLSNCPDQTLPTVPPLQSPQHSPDHLPE